MYKQSFFITFFVAMAALFFVALSFDGNDDLNPQVYGRMALPYQYISRVAVTPSCFPQEKVVGRTISVDCTETTELAEN